MAYVFFTAGMPAGLLHDRYGPHVLLAVGTVLFVLGVMMTSLAEKYYQFILAQGICSALGMACLFFPSMTDLMNWFSKKKPFAVGLGATGGGLGGVIFPLIAREMITDAGFGWTMRTCGFIILALSIAANLFAKARFPPGTRKRPKPNFAGLLHDTNYLLCCAVAFFAFGALWVVLTFIVTTAIARGVDPTWAFYLVPILNGSGVLGRLLCGAAALRLGPMNVYIVVTVISLILITCVWIPTSGQSAAIAFAVLYGFCSGGILSVGISITATLSEHDQRNMGLRLGLTFCCMAISW
jgi:MFS transporter, MCT family, aspergillic acid transporter